MIDRLITNPFPTPYHALKGNHEVLLESLLADPAIGQHWRRLGGLETLNSYGVSVSGLMLGKNYDEAADRLREAMPAVHVKFLQSRKTSHNHDKYFLCHAGVRPGVPLDRQSDEDVL